MPVAQGRIVGGRMISADDASTLLRPLFGRHMCGRALGNALDDELSLADPYDGTGVLLLPPGSTIDGDLALDYEAARVGDKAFRGVIAEGDLTIAGDIRNDNSDGGPFLVVLGRLVVRHILKQGAMMIALGHLTASGSILCSYNHGAFRAFAGLAARELIVDDHLVEIEGPCTADRFDLYRDDASRLSPEFVYVAEDDGVTYPVDDVSELIQQRILAGGRVLR